MIIEHVLLGGLVFGAWKLSEWVEKTDKEEKERLKAKSEQEKRTNGIIDSLSKSRQGLTESLIMLGNAKIQYGLQTYSSFVDIYRNLQIENNVEMLNKVRRKTFKHIKAEMLMQEIEILQSINDASKESAVIGIAVYGPEEIFNGKAEKKIKEDDTLVWLTGNAFSLKPRAGKVFSGKVSDTLLFMTLYSTDPELTSKTSISNSTLSQSAEKIVELISDLDNEIKAKYIEAIRLTSEKMEQLLDKANELLTNKGYNLRDHNDVGIDLLAQLFVYGDFMYKVLNTQLMQNGNFTDEIKELYCKNQNLLAPQTLNLTNYEEYATKYINYRDVVEELTSMNVKIVDEPSISEETLYFIAYEGDVSWSEPNKNSKLRTDPQLTNCFIENLDYLFEAFESDLGVEDKEPTNIYFLGDEQKYKKIKSYIENKFENIHFIKV